MGAAIFLCACAGRPPTAGVAAQRHLPAGDWRAASGELACATSLDVPVPGGEVSLLPFVYDAAPIERWRYEACVADGVCPARELSQPQGDGPDAPAVGMRWEHAHQFCRARAMSAQSEFQDSAINDSAGSPGLAPRLDRSRSRTHVVAGFRCTRSAERGACRGAAADAGASSSAPPIEEVAGEPGGPRVRETCPSMPAPRRASELIGATFENAARALPAGLRLAMEAAIDDPADWTVLSARRGAALVLLLAQPGGASSYRIVDALDLGTPCAGLTIEPRTCDLAGRPDPRVLALMSDVFSCGGHGESAPVRAWRIQGNRLVELDARRVTCGGESCEVDPPLERP